MFIFLGHEDVPVDVSYRRLKGETHVMQRIHIPRYRKAGVKFVVMATGGDPVRPFGTAGFRTQTIGAFKYLDDMFAEVDEAPDDLMIIRNAGDFQEALNGDKIGIILHFEGGTPLDGMMLIERSGMDTVLCIEFSLVFSEMTPLEFIKNILVEKIKVKKVVIGYNYHFGKGQMGDAQTLWDAGKVFNFEVEVVEPLKIGPTIVSSSKIRNLIQKGEIEEASTLLGRDYPIIGKVVEGAKRGQTLGFPTANLEISDELYPKGGVYAVEVALGVGSVLTVLPMSDSIIPGKEEFQETLRYFGRRIETTGVRLELGRAVTADELAAGGSDEIVLATGVIPRDPRIEGEDEFRTAGKVISYVELLLHGKPAGQRVAVIGAGPAGLSAAHDLALMGFRPVLFETEPLAAGMLAGWVCPLTACRAI